MKTLIAILLIFPSVAFGFCDNWETKHTWQEASFQILVLADWSQTLNAIKSGKPFSEMNPLLSTHPTSDELNTKIPAGMIIHALISCALPDGFRDIFQIGTSYVEFWFVHDNLKFGWSIGF